MIAQNGHRETVARRKINAPENWQWFAWECVEPDSVLLTGGVVTRTYSKGPRKGRPVYDKPHRTTIVTDAEAKAEEAAYVARTGNCGECLGTAQVFASWHHLTGTKLRMCNKCNGTGRANGEAAKALQDDPVERSGRDIDDAPRPQGLF